MTKEPSIRSNRDKKACRGTQGRHALDFQARQIWALHS